MQVLLNKCADGVDDALAKMNRQESIKKRTLDARQRMLRAHMKTLGQATLEQLETSTAQIIKHAPCDPTVNGGEMPHAKAIQRCLEALSAFLLDEEPRAQKGWDSFASTTFPATMRSWFNQACKAAAGQFDAGVTKKLKAWKKGIGYAERIMNDPALAPSQIRKMSTAGHQVGIPVSVFVQGGLRVLSSRFFSTFARGVGDGVRRVQG